MSIKIWKQRFVSSVNFVVDYFSLKLLCFQELNEILLRRRKVRGKLFKQANIKSFDAFLQSLKK